MRPRRRCGNVLVAAALATAAALTVQRRPHALSTSEQDFTLALTGDSIITRPLALYHEPEFLKLIEIIRGADAAFTNLEMLFHDYESYPMHESGGTWMRADPRLVKDLVWAGFWSRVACQQPRRRLRRGRHAPDDEIHARSRPRP